MNLLIAKQHVNIIKQLFIKLNTNQIYIYV